MQSFNALPPFALIRHFDFAASIFQRLTARIYLYNVYLYNVYVFPFFCMYSVLDTSHVCIQRAHCLTFSYAIFTKAYRLFITRWRDMFVKMGMDYEETLRFMKLDGSVML